MVTLLIGLNCLLLGAGAGVLAHALLARKPTENPSQSVGGLVESMQQTNQALLAAVLARDAGMGKMSLARQLAPTGAIAGNLAEEMAQAMNDAQAAAEREREMTTTVTVGGE